MTDSLGTLLMKIHRERELFQQIFGNYESANVLEYTCGGVGGYVTADLFIMVLVDCKFPRQFQLSQLLRVC